MLNRIVVVVFGIGTLLTTDAAWAAPAVQPEAVSAVTFNKDVLPILQQNCQSCHRPGQVAPFSLLSYKEARPWAKAMKEAVVSRRMPPWLADPQYGHFLNDRSLKQADIDKVVAWADNAAPEGNPKDAPAPIQWPAEGWSVKPDVVVNLPDFDVPAKEVLEWQTLVLPAPFKEDTWVTSMEILPSVAEVVHHICFSFVKHRPTTIYNRYQWAEIPRDALGVATVPKQSGLPILTRDVGSTEIKRGESRNVGGGGLDFCYLPGAVHDDYRPWNAGRLIPAGSDMVFSIHYTPNGKTAVVDRSKVGFTISNVPPENKFIVEGAGEEPPPPGTERQEFAIPPNEGNYIAPPMDFTFLKDVDLVRLRPHMHNYGKSAQYTLTYSDGRKETILNVPRYDFNWQLSYKTSIRVPKGSKLHVQFAYDNSVNNKFALDPSKWVRYGDQSWEEMMAPNLGFVVPRDADAASLIRADRR